jgi:hypothetical protein
MPIDEAAALHKLDARLLAALGARSRQGDNVITIQLDPRSARLPEDTWTIRFERHGGAFAVLVRRAVHRLGALEPAALEPTAGAAAACDPAAWDPAAREPAA